MAYDAKIDSAKMAADLTGIADAIREKSGGTTQLAFPAGFVAEVKRIDTGTRDYEALTNKPQINSVTLIGNKTSGQLGLADAYELATSAQIDSLF